MGDVQDPILQSISDTKVDYVRLGKSGLRVSVPILGAMAFGAKEWMPWCLEEDEALPILKAAYDAGVNTWDTANVYSNGLSEQIIGKAMNVYQIPREKVVILTKCGQVVGETPTSRTMMHKDRIGASKDYMNAGGLSRKAIFSAVDGSLRRLGTSYIDLLQIHRFDPDTPIEETMAALHDLVRDGRVRYIGASSMWTYQFAMMQHMAETKGWTKFVSMQNHYNLLYREEEREMNRYCNETGVGLIPWAPLCRGFLARTPSTPGDSMRAKIEVKRAIMPSGHSDEDQVIIQRVHELANKKGWTMSQVALAWIQKRVSSPVVGFSKLQRINETVDTRGKRLTEEEEAYLEAPYQTRHIQGHN